MPESDPQAQVRQACFSLVARISSIFPSGNCSQVHARRPEGLRDLARLAERRGGQGGSTDQPGTGLGLFLARELAEINGATLLYEARKGGGSIFRLVFADPTRWELR